MRLSDIMSNMNLAVWPSIALIIFLGVFIGVVLRLMSRPRSGWDQLGRLAVEEPARAAVEPAKEVRS